MVRWYALALAGCGRIAFDPTPTRDGAIASDSASDADDCRFIDNFTAGAGAWTELTGTGSIDPTGGPDNSSAYHVTGATSSTGALISHPSLVGFDALHVAMDFNLTLSTSDFNVMLYPPGWTTGFEANYEVGLFALGGDTAPDWIARFLPPSDTSILTMHALTVPMGVWHHVDVRRFTDGRIDVLLDGAPYMSSPANADIPAPLSIVVRVYNEGYIDNVDVTCVP